MFSLLLAMKTRNSNGGYKVNDPALLSQYKSPLLGQPSLSWNFYDPSMSSFTNQAHPFRHHLHSKKGGIKQNKALLFFSTKNPCVLPFTINSVLLSDSSVVGQRWALFILALENV